MYPESHLLLAEVGWWIILEMCAGDGAALGQFRAAPSKLLESFCFISCCIQQKTAGSPRQRPKTQLVLSRGYWVIENTRLILGRITREFRGRQNRYLTLGKTTLGPHEKSAPYKPSPGTCAARDGTCFLPAVLPEGLCGLRCWRDPMHPPGGSSNVQEGLICGIKRSLRDLYKDSKPVWQDGFGAPKRKEVPLSSQAWWLRGHEKPKASGLHSDKTQFSAPKLPPVKYRQHSEMKYVYNILDTV